MSNVQAAIFDFFSQLPYVPLEEVFKHLGHLEMMHGIVHSVNWRNAIVHRMRMNSSQSGLNVQLDNDCMELEVKSAASTFIFRFLQSFEHGEEVFSEHRPCLGEILHGEGFLISVQSKSVKKLESLYLEVLVYFSTVLPAKVNSVFISLNRFPPEFNDSVLLALPKGTGNTLELRTGEEKIEIKASTVKHVLENIKFKRDILLEGIMEEVFKSDQMNLNVTDRIELQDARFLTKSHLLSMKMKHGEFGANSFKSEDFNQFLKRWINDDSSILTSAKFAISAQQNIQLVEVFGGLDARPWNPSQRDKSCRYNGGWMNMQDGIDITNVKGMLLTIKLTSDYILFITWPDCRPVQSEKYWPTETIAYQQRQLAEHEQLRERYQNQLTMLEYNHVYVRLLLLKTEKDIKDCKLIIEQNSKILEELRKFE